MKPMTHPTRAFGGAFAALLGVLITALLAPIGPALADGDPTTDAVPRLLPYEGVLERDGQRVDAHGEDALMVLFSLYDSPEAAVPVYRQPLRLDVYDGEFTTAIGPVGLGPDDTERSIADIIAAADTLSLGITLLGDPDDPTDDIPLSRRQPIRATPYALWTTSATDISIGDSAQVDGDLTVGGALAVGGSLQVEGDVTLPSGAIDTVEVADGSLTARVLDGAMLGDGFGRGGGSLRVDTGWFDGEIRGAVRANCRLFLGWRDNCNNCDLAPAKQVEVRADGTCISGVGADTRCRANNAWGGVNTDGDVDGNDVFYIRMICD